MSCPKFNSWILEWILTLPLGLEWPGHVFKTGHVLGITSRIEYEKGEDKGFIEFPDMMTSLVKWPNPGLLLTYTHSRVISTKARHFFPYTEINSKLNSNSYKDIFAIDLFIDSGNLWNQNLKSRAWIHGSTAERVLT